MAGGGDRAGDGDLSRRPIAASFLHYLLPSPKPRSSSPPPAAPLVPPHRLMAPPLPRDESLFIVRPERPSWLPPPPPPHPAAPPHERKPRAFAVGGRKAPPFPLGRPHTGPFRTEGGGVGRERRKVGAFVGNGGGTSTERQKAAQKEKKVWVAVDRRQEKGCDEEVVVVGGGNVGGEDGVLEEEVEEEEEEGDGVLEDEVKNSLVIGDGEVGGGGGERLRLSKDLMSDSPTGLQVPGFRGRMHRKKIICRPDIETLTSGLLSLYESLKPQEEQKCKQKQLIVSLKESVNKEWPDAQLHLFGSSANSFGTFHSDVDVCLAIDKSAGSSTDILLKLADILEADNFDNVEAITNARVPIVRMSDPESGISCDICINNVFAVANTKLLKDYAQIDDRLLQLAFIVKYWAKSRGVNETYHGTLSSYAYVLMCINFLQLREPSILPCLQTMEPTYTMIADDTECAYFDKVHQLADFGAENKEGIAELLWAFFHYWAYGHNYRNDVISVRTGKIISKREKNWTTRVANDRHLMCIEDPFETVHDLGRVVDRRTLRILREEFERAAEILQYDDNPCLTLFEPYELGSAQHDWP